MQSKAKYIFWMLTPCKNAILEEYMQAKPSIYAGCSLDASKAMYANIFGNQS
jgi:hypothetical protein